MNNYKKKMKLLETKKLYKKRKNVASNGNKLNKQLKQKKKTRQTNIKRDK